MPTSLIEHTSSGVKARIRLMSAGQGSSGYYPAEVLERDGASAFPAGSFLYYDHATESEVYDRNGSRSVKDIVGKLITSAEYIAEEQALYADALFYSHSAEHVMAIAEDVDLSIEGSGSKDPETDHITALHPNPHNGVALVPNGGRDGKITAFLESLTPPEFTVQESGKIELIEHTPEKDSEKMTPEDIQSLAEALVKAIAPSLEEIKESLKPAAPEVPETESVADVVEAIIAADLPEDLRAEVYESDKPIEEIARIKKIRESFKATDESVAQPGRVQESATAQNFTSTAWSNR